VVAGLLAAFGVPAATTAQEATPAIQRATPGAAETSWLYVQAFASATLAQDPAAPDEPRLTIMGLDEDVLGFNDGSPREVATVTTAEFASMIAAQVTNPLPATLVASLASGMRAAVLLELQTADRIVATGTVTYVVTVLGEDDGPARTGTPLVGPAEERVFGAGHLFVEACKPGCCSCPGGCTCNEETCAKLCL
jgi:hypothetical protein